MRIVMKPDCCASCPDRIKSVVFLSLKMLAGLLGMAANEGYHLLSMLGGCYGTMVWRRD
jgi:hypothetical protein